MARFRVEFDGLNELIERITKLDGNVKNVTEKALKATHAHITPKLHEDMKPHNRSGARTEKSIQDNPKITWAGDVASVDIGFDIGNGGLASVFLMYGTKVYGTPRTPKDQKLYNDVYGKKTTADIRTLQQDIFYDELRKLGG